MKKGTEKTKTCIIQFPLSTSLKEDWGYCCHRHFDWIPGDLQDSKYSTSTEWLKKYILATMDLVNSQKYSLDELLVCDIEQVRLVVKILLDVKGGAS